MTPQALTGLTDLDLSCNLLSTVEPGEVRSLTRLTCLNLEFNRLSRVPAHFAALSALRALHLGFNVLTALPHELGALPSLTALTFPGNRLKRPPPEVLEQDAAVVIDYLRRLYAARATDALDLARLKLRAVPDEVPPPHP